MKMDGLPPGVIDWTKPPPLWIRFKYRMPCWLTGHAEVMLDPFKDPRDLWCMKCNLRRRDEY